jgi:dUTP pyrophosphatase
MVKLKIKRLNTSAKLPTKANPLDEGWDLYSNETTLVPAHGVKAIKTGVCVEFPSTHWGQIEGRSGIAARSGVSPIGGIVDSGYRGEIGVILMNPTDSHLTIQNGDKIAQMVVRQHIESEIEEVAEVGETVRGDKGFGSSGK